jgi:hypothetical protein
MLEERPVSQNTDPHSGQVWTYSVSKTRVILTFLPVTAPTRLRTLRLVCPLAVAVGCNPLNLREDSQQIPENLSRKGCALIIGEPRG